MVQGSGVRVKSLGFRFQVLGFRFYGMSCAGLVLRVAGPECTPCGDVDGPQAVAQEAGCAS